MLVGTKSIAFFMGDVTFLNIGNNNNKRARDISPGTLQGGGVTNIGSNCLLMASVHIGTIRSLATSYNSE